MHVSKTDHSVFGSGFYLHCAVQKCQSNLKSPTQKGADNSPREENSLIHRLNKVLMKINNSLGDRKYH